MKKTAIVVLSIVLIILPAGKTYSQNTEYSSARNWWVESWVVTPLQSAKSKQLPLLSVDGNQIVDEKGNSILIRGICVQDPDKAETSKQWNREYFEHVKETGAMLVRIPVHPIGWTWRTPERYIELLDKAIDWCTDLGMYVMIDWHIIGNLKTGLFQHPIYNTSLLETYRFWRTMAIRYKGHNTVAFYEICNEPTTYFGQLGSMEWKEWKRINEDIIQLIRSIDQDPIPMVAGLNLGYDLRGVEDDPVEAEEIVYVSHPYEFKQDKPYKKNWEKNFAFVAEKYPLIVSEYAFDLEPGTLADENHYASQLIDFLEEKNIGWVCWIYDDVWPPSLVKSLRTYELTGSGEFFKQALQGKLAVQND